MTDAPRLIPTGTCWCGCGKEASRGSFFARGHDKTAEAAFMAVHYGGSVARLLAENGFGPDGKETIHEAALDRGGWTTCSRGCGYAGNPASVTRHEAKPHKES